MPCSIAMSRPSNFYPRPPRGGRLQLGISPCPVTKFLSTPSARRATQHDFHVWRIHDISIHALREEGDRRSSKKPMGSKISIHALREEGDSSQWPGRGQFRNFYPRPPRGGRPGGQSGSTSNNNFYPRPPRGGRQRACRIGVDALKFLSTPSARRATMFHLAFHLILGISIHALREEGDHKGLPHRVDLQNFYPRPPRGGRHELDCNQLNTKEFLSTPSARRATRSVSPAPVWQTISIHALREEGDTGCLFHLIGGSRYFYPRPPRGGRQQTFPLTTTTVQFLSTPSARRATHAVQLVAEVKRISIHALREEGDCDPLELFQLNRYFYPRPPRGGRPRHSLLPRADRGISIHALREEGDLLCGSCWGVLSISIHALREEGDPSAVFTTSTDCGFLSTPSARRATTSPATRTSDSSDFYPRPPRGGRQPLRGFPKVCNEISIHALREEGDDRAVVRDHECRGFLSTPSARRATRSLREHLPQRQFLSTPSARRATRGGD